MKCPFCGQPDSKVIDSRPTADGNSIRRRRECESCQKRFTTFETIETVQIIVVKKSGVKELFDKQKLLSASSKQPKNARSTRLSSSTRSRPNCKTPCARRSLRPRSARWSCANSKRETKLPTCALPRFTASSRILIPS